VQPRSPTAVDLAVLCGTVLGLVALAHEAGLPHLFGRSAALGLAALAIVTIGVPGLAWGLDWGRGSVLALVLTGAAGGAVAPLLLLASGSLRVFFLEDLEYLLGVLAYGAIIPGRGPLAWTRFLTLMAESVSIGLAAGLLVWVAGRIRRVES
jgi:hypothetical protein